MARRDGVALGTGTSPCSANRRVAAAAGAVPAPHLCPVFRATCPDDARGWWAGAPRCAGWRVWLALSRLGPGAPGEMRLNRNLPASG